MKKIKVGYLPLYIKLYDDSDPHYRDPMVDYMHMLVSMLESQGLEVVLPPDICRVKAEFDAAARLFNDADVDAVITQHLAYSPSLESLDALLSLKAPIVVFDTTPDYELLSVSGYKGCISANHGIHGVQDMTSMLRRNGKPYYLCVGHALHSEVVSEVVGMCRAAAAAKAFKTAKVGSVGGSFVGMGDFLISDADYKAKIGADVKYMSKAEVKACVAAVTDAEIDAEIACNKQEFTYEITDEANYREAVRSCLALRRWVEASGLTAVTVNFLTLDACGMPKMPFVECSKLLTRGCGYAGEGDVLTAGLVGALRSVYPETTFTEMFCPDWKEDMILLSHMGEMNFDLAKWRPVLRSTPFNYNACGDTAAAYMCLRPGKAVLVNLAPMGEKLSLIATPVCLTDDGLEYGVYRSSDQGWLKPCRPLRAFLKEYSLLGGTHHSALVYNADIREIETFGQMMGFDVHTIE